MATIIGFDGQRIFWNDDSGFVKSTLINAPQPFPLFSILTDAPTIVWPMAQQQFANASVILGGNRTLSIQAPAVGGSYVLKIVQDGVGSRTLTLGGGNWKVINGGNGAISLTATANAVDVLAFTYDGTNFYANIGPNYT